MQGGSNGSRGAEPPEPPLTLTAGQRPGDRLQLVKLEVRRPADRRRQSAVDCHVEVVCSDIDVDC